MVRRSRTAPAVLPGYHSYLAAGGHRTTLPVGGDIRQRLDTADPPDAQGWRTLTLVFDSLYDARRQLLACAAVRSAGAEPLRLSLLIFARQIVQHYTT